MTFLSKPLGYLLEWLSTIFSGNFALSVFVFTLLINLAMLPLTIKTQKTTSKQARLRPKLDALKKKYGDDRQKMAQATQELYSKENVSMTGGCLPMIIRMVVIFAVYYVISDPLQYLLQFSANDVKAVFDALKSAGFAVERNVDIIKYINDGTVAGLGGLDATLVENMKTAISGINFNFLGIDLTQTPTFSLKLSEMFSNNLWIIPFASLASNLAQSFVSTSMQKKANPEAPNMTMMLLLMPIMSFIITFKVPCALGFYWTLSSLIGGCLQIFTQYLYNPQRIIAGEQAKDIIKLAKLEESAKKGKAE